MIMLTGSFIHVVVQQSGKGNRHTGNSYVKHRLPHTFPCNCQNWVTTKQLTLPSNIGWYPKLLPSPGMLWMLSRNP